MDELDGWGHGKIHKGQGLWLLLDTSPYGCVGKGPLNWVGSGPPENPGTVLDPAVQKHERLNIYRQPNGGHRERPWLPFMQLKTPGKGPRLRGLELGVACGN